MFNISIKPITSPETAVSVVQAAEADNHLIISPTHYGISNGEIIAYASLFASPVVHTWTHTKKISVRDSLFLLKSVETLAANAGRDHIILPCTKESPYFSYMEKLGYTSLGERTMFCKKL